MTSDPIIRNVLPDERGSNVGHVLGIPVTLDIILGSSKMPLSTLLELSQGSILPLDRKATDAVDVSVNGRLVARGVIVVLENDPASIGISLTEIV